MNTVNLEKNINLNSKSDIWTITTYSIGNKLKFISECPTIIRKCKIVSNCTVQLREITNQCGDKKKGWTKATSKSQFNIIADEGYVNSLDTENTSIVNF